MLRLFLNPILKYWIRGLVVATFSLIVALFLVWQTLCVKRGQSGLIYLAPHSTASSLSQILYQRRLLKYPVILRLYLRTRHLAQRLKPGYYAYTVNDSLSDLVSNMVRGKVYTIPLTIIEGSRLCELQLRWSNAKDYQFKAEMLARFPNTHGSLEGLFFPSTYLQAYGESMLPVLKLAYQTLEQKLQQIWQARADDLPYKNPYELLIAASIIEKETADKNERYFISAVIRNRLHQGMRLQMDPTVAYGLSGCIHRRLKGSDVKIDSAYNTYIHAGLPPTPIAMVSAAALEAAAHPAKVNYLYFVAKGDGHHVFSSDYLHQQKAINLYLRTKHEQ